MAQKNALFDRYTSPLEVKAMDLFVVSQHFRERRTADMSPGVRIIRATELFTKELLPLAEWHIPPGIVSRARLAYAATNQTIIDALGVTRQSYLADLWQLLVLQPNGEHGRLPTNGRVSIIYVKTASGELMSAYARWYRDERGWGVGCVPFKPNISPWEEGDVVLHR